MEPTRVKTEEATPPWTPEILEAWVREEPNLRGALRPLDPETSRYELRLPDGQHGQVTFRPQEFEAHPNTVALLAYGHPWWEIWLDTLESTLHYTALGTLRSRLLILRSQEKPPLSVWYVRTAETEIQRVLTLDHLRQVVQEWANLLPWNDDAVTIAEKDFRRLLQEHKSRWIKNKTQLVDLWRRSLLARGQYLWQYCGVLVWMQIHQQPLFRAKFPYNQMGQTIRSWGEPFEHLWQVLSAEKADTSFDIETIQKIAQNAKKGHLENFSQSSVSLGRRIQRWLDEWKQFQNWKTKEKVAQVIPSMEKFWI